MKTAKEFWKDKFFELPQDDSERLAILMMVEYADYVKNHSDALVPPILSKAISEKIAKYLLGIFWAGLHGHPNNSSVRNLTIDEYYCLNKKDWDLKAEAVIKFITEQ